MSAAGRGVLAGKVVLVAGVGPGLGRSLALRSAAAGADVVLAARNPDRLAAVAGEVERLGRRAVVLPTDLDDPAAVEALAADAVQRAGRLDAVVHNAFHPPGREPLLDADLAAIGSELASSVTALDLVRRCAPALVEAGGSVVLVNSMILRNRLPGFGAYRMTKASLLALARGLSIELGPRGVRVNSIAPGYIVGDDTAPRDVHAEAAAATDLRRLPHPDEVADAAVFLASDLARAVTGQCLDVTCGATHH